MVEKLSYLKRYELNLIFFTSIMNRELLNTCISIYTNNEKGLLRLSERFHELYEQLYVPNAISG